MFSTLRASSSAASVDQREKFAEAEAASAKTIAMGFPTYDLTSKRLKPVLTDFELKSLQNELQELQELRRKFNQSLLSEERKKEIKTRIAALEESLKQTKGLKFFILGCQGNAKKDQKKVARLMSEIALDPANKPDFILILGDNFYDYGVHTPDDEMFKTHFEKIYGKRYLAIRDIPCFVILGNHDENIHKMSMGKKQGVEVGMNQVLHSYLKNPETYANPTLNLDQLPKWNMPARAYSLRFADTEIFCIDSNTYALDFLAAQKGDKSLTNQAVWLETKVKQAQAEGRKVMLAMHHPLVTQGKRAFISDLDLYVPKEAVQELQEFLPNPIHDLSYNALLNEIMQKQGLVFGAVMSAHDHYQAYYNNILVEAKNRRLCQITAGGGGGSIHARKQFQTQAEMGYFIKDHGFTMVTSEIHNPELKFATYSVKQPGPIKFTNQSPRPIQYWPANIEYGEKRNLQKLYAALYQASLEYFAFIGASEPSAQKSLREKSLGLFSRHGKEGIDRAHKLWGYLNVMKQHNYKMALEQTTRILEGGPTVPDENSLITFVNKHIGISFGESETLKSLIEDNEEFVMLPELTKPN